jgi:hypothetical protein
MESLYSQIRDSRIAAGLEKVRELAEKQPVQSVAAIADSIDELDRLIAIHQKCSALLKAHMAKMAQPDL